MCQDQEVKQKNRGNVYSCRKLRKEEIKGRKHQRSHSQLVDQPELPLPSEVTFGLRLLHTTVPVRKAPCCLGHTAGVLPGGRGWYDAGVSRALAVLPIGFL